MKYAFFFIILICTFSSCNDPQPESASLIDYCPDNAAFHIKINDFDTFQSELKNNTFIQATSTTSVITDIVHKTAPLRNILSATEGVFSLVEVGKENFEFVFTTVATPTTSDSSVTTEQLTHNGTAYTKATRNDKSVYFITKGSYNIITSSSLLMENYIRTAPKSNSKSLNMLYQTASNTSSATLFIQSKYAESFVSAYQTNSKNKGISRLANWLALDFNASQDDITMSGVSLANDSLPHVLNLFKNTRPLPSTAARFLPANTQNVISYTFDSYTTFAKNRLQFMQQQIQPDTLFAQVEEIATAQINDADVIFISTYGGERLSDYITTLNQESEDYQGTAITTIASSTFIPHAFSPIVSNAATPYVVALENAFIFSSSKEALQNIISNYKNSTTLHTTGRYAQLKNNLADDASILFISSGAGVSNSFNSSVSSEITSILTNKKHKELNFAVQFISDADFYHTTLYIGKAKEEQQQNTTAPLFTVQLDADLATTPQFVINHRTKEKEIVVQDITNHLYLISNKGKVLWKKELSGPIQGKIEQVDLYKNGRLQLAFTTTHDFIILDRNGKEVAPFNMSFKGSPLNPLAVFDYDNNRNYRFIVTQANKSFMYDRSGKTVKGYEYTTAESTIKYPPQHFRIQKKDYIGYQLTNGKLELLDRTGKTRIPVSNSIAFSNNPISLYKDTFTVSDENGVLYQIDTKGKQQLTNFNASKDHSFTTTSKTLAFLNENILSIKGKKITLDFGVYTAPVIFYINNKIYVSTTDLQNQKTYLFDSNGKSIANFPVYGNSAIALDDIDNDGKLELAVKDLAHSIMLYRLN